MFKHKDHTHQTVAQARECEFGKMVIGGTVLGLSQECRGGKCTSIYDLCSRHQMQYQTRYGRASNE
jgi:hypothetical protein